MGIEAEKLDGIEWIDPVSHSVMSDETLSAKIHNQIPGVVGKNISFHPLVEGRRLIDGMPVHAFYMRDTNGPFVGIREVPTSPETDHPQL